MMTHEPKNKYCAVCNRAKTQRKPKRKGQLDLGPKPLNFGDQLTGDLLIKNKTNVSAVINDTEVEDSDPMNWIDFELSDVANSAIVLFDRAIDWLGCFPKATRSEAHIIEAMQEFAKPSDKI